jgi:hypothetical protein
VFLLSPHWARHLYHLDGVHPVKHTTTAAVLRTPTKETRLLDEENCCILYVLISFNVWNFIVSFRITYGKWCQRSCWNSSWLFIELRINIHCHQQNFPCYCLSWLQSVHFLSLLRIFKIDINVILRFTKNIRSVFLWLFLTRFFKISICELHILPL